MFLAVLTSLIVTNIQVADALIVIYKSCEGSSLTYFPRAWSNKEHATLFQMNLISYYKYGYGLHFIWFVALKKKKEHEKIHLIILQTVVERMKDSKFLPLEYCIIYKQVAVNFVRSIPGKKEKEKKVGVVLKFYNYLASIPMNECAGFFALEVQSAIQKSVSIYIGLHCSYSCGPKWARPI